MSAGRAAEGTFVSVGNATRPFNRLLDEVIKLVPDLPRPVVVQHGVAPFPSKVCIAVPFLSMVEFERLMCESELLILHAGAGSVIHAVRAGKVPVVIPRRAGYDEIVDDHQVELAKALAAAGRVVAIDDVAQLCDAAKTALVLQREMHQASGTSTMLKLIGETLARYAERFP